MTKTGVRSMGKLYADRAVAIFESQVGYKEKATNAQLDDFEANAGAGNWTKYARDLFQAGWYGGGQKNGHPWCTTSYDWVIWQACGCDSVKAQHALCYTGPYGAGCKCSVQYYKEAGRFYPRAQATPKPGDQIFFGNPASHTGMVRRIEDGKVYTVEGNSGNAVRFRSYELTDGSILGYGRPRYDGDVTPAGNDEPAPEPDTYILPGTPFTDVPEDRWSAEAIRWLYERGFVAGVAADKFGPKQSMTREQAAVILCKIAKAAGIE